MRARRMAGVTMRTLLGVGLLFGGAATAAPAPKPGSHHGRTHAPRAAGPQLRAAHSGEARVLTLTARKGDTLLNLMRRQKLAGPQNMHAILEAGRKGTGPLRIGDRVMVQVDGKGPGARIRAIRVGAAAAVLNLAQAPCPKPKTKSRRAGAAGFAAAAPVRRAAAAGTGTGAARPKDAVLVPVAMSAPLARTKVTSPYGWRVHPVLGSWRFHDGVDFGAPQGTPVRAAADGVIADLGRRGNYGDYIRLRHSEHLETAYAHLAGFAPGLRAGSTVNRGQVIGYVGRTGLATGCHLYYEVILNGRHLDPLKVESLPAAMKGGRSAGLGGGQQVARN